MGFYVWRGFVEFDTSGIDDDATIAQANVYLTAAGIDNEYDFDVRVHKFDWASPIAAGNREANYDGALASTFDAVWRNTSAIVANTSYASSNLDTTWVSKTGFTRYALLSSRDVSATEPDWNLEQIAIYAQEHATQAYRPYLSVTVAAAGQPMMLRGTTVPHMRQWHPRF